MSKSRWRKWQENWMKPEIKVKTDTFYTYNLIMWSLLPCYCWHSWACLDYNPRFNTAFQCGFIKVNHLLHLGHGRNEASELANSLSDWFISLASSRDGLGGRSSCFHVTRCVYCSIRRTLQQNSMSESNKREQRTSAKHQKPNPLRWETTTVDSAAYGQDTALQQGQIMIDASSSSLYTQSRLYSQEKLHNSQMSK